MSDKQRVPGQVFEPTVQLDEPVMVPRRQQDSERTPGQVAGPTAVLAAEGAPPPIAGDQPPASGSRPRRGWWQWSGLWGSALLLAWCGYGWLAGLMALLRDNLVAGLALSALSAATIAAVAVAVAREISAFRAIDRLAVRDRQLADALAGNRLELAKDCLADTLANLRRRQPALIQPFDEAARTVTRAEDYLRQFDNLVLHPLDQQAGDLIRQQALGTGMAVAIIPHPAFDAALVLLRGVALTRRLGELYGLQPTGLASLKLFRYTLDSMLLAATLDMGSDALLDALGADLAKTFAKHASEAGVTGYRMYRLGKMTQRVCRPSVPGDVPLS